MVSVFSIIVTYNGMQWIERCLDCLLKSELQTHVVIVDNGSGDGTVDFIKARYPSVELIETGKNLGFGQGNNIGLRSALQNNADYVFLLNQDAYIQPQTIAELVKAHISHPEFGILSPVHLNGTGANFDDHFYQYLLKSDIKDMISSCLIKDEKHHSIISTPFVNAAAWLISKDCLTKTGGFDPIFFHYGEDDNYAQRVLFKKFKIGILPASRVIHDRNRPSGQVPADVKTRIKKDWIHFLNQPCDIRNNKYLSLMVKRCLRYALQVLGSAITFNKTELVYNFTMMRKILFSIAAVRRSRRISLAGNGIPHL
ncbi:MAG: glycosyltransferase family 2 protein [Chitinophagaceae bacterium]|nr:glycosyltransferase family 2 protein [Chitinophagaceae bacterium]